MPLVLELFPQEMKSLPLVSNCCSCATQRLCGTCMRLLLGMAVVPGLLPPPVAGPAKPLLAGGAEHAGWIHALVII